jgi:thioredoxin type arsenate reductase
MPGSAKKRVLFLCVGNSCRSQMAEGLLNHIAADAFDIHSAGAVATGLNPRAVEVMAEVGIDISAQWSKVVEQFAKETFDYVVTLCDESENNPCPVFLGEAGRRMHVPFDDPAYATGSEQDILDFFRRVRDQINQWLETFADDITSQQRGEVAARREQLVQEMKTLFHNDQRRIDHALKVLEYAETILPEETADPLTVKAAAILHDIGIHEAERKHGSAAGRFQELEGPPIARRIMERIGIDDDTIDHACRIVGSHHSAGKMHTPEFHIVWDADWLVNIPEEHATADRDKLARLVDRVFKTEKGHKLAEELFL